MRIALRKDLAPLREQAMHRVDQEAEAQRLRHVTPGAGQAIVYERKLAEARAVLADKDPEPVFVADAEEAEAVIEAAARCNRALAAIEAARLAAKQAIRAATCPAEIDAAAAVDWPA